MSDGDASFLEIEGGYKYSKNSKKLNWSIYAGYRYNDLEASFDPEATYSIIADFTTVFKGPFVSFVASF